jgi:hypothetical protein
MRSALTFIENADKVPYQQTPSWNWDEAFKNQVVSEAKFWLAFHHFEYAKRFGGIPLMYKRPTFTNTGSGLVIDPNGERRSLRSTFNFILKLCDEIIPYLPDNIAQEQKGRVTKSAAHALKSKVLLFAASPLYNEPAILSFGNAAKDSLITFYPNVETDRWIKARDAAKAAIDWAESVGYVLLNDPNYSKTANYLYASTTPNSTVPLNKEVFLDRRDSNAAPLAEFFSQGSATKGTINQRQASVGVDFVKNNFRTIDGKDVVIPDNGNFTKLKEIFRKLEPRFHAIAWVPGDYYSELNIAEQISYGGRDSSLFFYYDVAEKMQTAKTSSPNEFYGPHQGFFFEKKWHQFGNAANNPRIGWPLFRLPELYLNYAEAANEINPNDPLILAYLNKIRARGGLPNLESVPVSNSKIGNKELMRQEILRERAIELWGEEHRYFDVRRWKKAEVNGGKWYTVELYENGTGTYVNPTGSWTPAMLQANNEKLSYRIVESHTGGNSFSPRVWSEKMYFYPWLQTEINKGIIIQNPGW